MTNSKFSDQDMINDVLSTQKFITSGYNNSANEASEPTVKNAMMSILDEEHVIQHQIFEEMQSRGWYPTEAAPMDKINQAKDKFATNCQNCYL